MKTQATCRKFKFPIIETKRLILREFCTDDLETAYLLFNDAIVQKYLSPENKRTYSQLEQTLKSLSERWKERSFGIWCVCSKSDNKMIGYCGFQYFENTSNIEIVFAYLESVWGKGFATEVADSCLQFGFENLNFSRVFAATHIENLASKSVLSKIGMKFVENRNLHKIDASVYQIEKNDFMQIKQISG